MSDSGKWVQEGIAKLRDSINDGETVKITHFVLSGSANLGSLPDFAVADNMSMGTFPRQVYGGPVSYSFINGDGFLQVHAEVAADVETEFYSNGIGLIFEDVMERKWLMAIGAVPLQQHARMVNNTFQFVLPIVNDVADIIEVTMEPGDRVSQVQLSGAVAAHSDSTDAHADYRNAAGAALLYAMDSLGIAHRNIDDNQVAIEGNREEAANSATTHNESVDAHADYRNAAGAALMHAIDSLGIAHRSIKDNQTAIQEGAASQTEMAGELSGVSDSVALAHSEIQKTLEQRFQNGMTTINNRGIIAGCEVSPSNDAVRNLSMTGGRAFGGGVIKPISEQNNGAVVPANGGSVTDVYYVYLDENSDMTCVPESSENGGILLYKVEVPPGNIESTDPYLANITLTDMRRMEPDYPIIMSSCPTYFIGFDHVFDSNDYALNLVIGDYTGSSFGLGRMEVQYRTQNGFMVQHTGIVDNVDLHWSAHKLDS